MLDWGGKIAAWFAAVAGVSSGLAALIGTTVKQPLHGWGQVLFVTLVVIAAVSFIMLLFTGPQAIWATWQKWKRTPKVAERLPLVVEITEAQFENWKYLALIAALRVKVTNTTDQPIRLSAIGFTHDPEGQTSWLEQGSADDRLELDRELYARRERQFYGIPLSNYSMVPPNESISGWVISVVARPASGTPLCKVTVKDAIGNQYEAVFPKQEAQTYGP